MMRVDRGLLIGGRHGVEQLGLDLGDGLAGHDGLVGEIGREMGRVLAGQGHDVLDLAGRINALAGAAAVTPSRTKMAAMEGAPP